MPQDKKRVYRNRMLAERRRLQKTLELLAAGEALPEADQPLTSEGVPMTAAQIRDRIADLERQLHLKPHEDAEVRD
jgi:hypothetical protein